MERYIKIGVAYVFTDMKDNKSNDQEIDLIGSYQFRVQTYKWVFFPMRFKNSLN